jgi:hypothetical protein
VLRIRIDPVRDHVGERKAALVDLLVRAHA